MSLVTLFIHKRITWEHDFICNDLLRNIPFQTHYFDDLFVPFKAEVEDKGPSILAIDCRTTNAIPIATELQPRVILFMSDETGSRSQMAVELAKHCSILFKQYHHRTTDDEHIFQLALGYCSGFLDGECKSQSEENQYICSFVGTEKSDRREMIDTFRSFESSRFEITSNNWQIAQQVIPPSMCRDIYNKSMFVLQGRGYVSLDCFRIYEALAAGSVPIIVGTKEEMAATFYFNGKMPPFLFCSTWEEAKAKVEYYMANKNAYDELKKQCVNWWNQHISFVNQMIQNCL
jgi:hypothetical protein